MKKDQAYEELGGVRSQFTELGFNDVVALERLRLKARLILTHTEGFSGVGYTNRLDAVSLGLLPINPRTDMLPRSAGTIPWEEGKAASVRIIDEALVELEFLIEEERPTEEAQVLEAPNLPHGKKVFIVHGRQLELAQAVAGFLKRGGLEPVILTDMPSAGLTIIEKLEKHAAHAIYAVVLMTPDDVATTLGDLPEGKRASLTESFAMRARQNVILELG